ncbi:MAG: hypothetical protein Q8P59_07285 [Dehalococcoidia bacterium]|nr:hypothetical protein [Dehalococcoidia bacterium]
MAYQRWPWLLEDYASGELGVEVEALMSTQAAALLGEGGYPVLFSLSDGVGFFAVGPGRELLYYFDRRRDTAFLFPNSAG